MSAFSERFCLKEHRKNFQINVRSSPEDREVYFGGSTLNADLVRKFGERYEMGIPPKAYLYGLYGAGKTHTLFNIKYQLEEGTKAIEGVDCRIIECEFRKKTDFRYMHGQILEEIGLEEVRRLIQQYVQNNATGNIPELLKARFADANIVKSIHTLAMGSRDVTLWKWLCANPVSAAELNALGLTKNLDQVGEMVTTLVGIASLFQEVDNKKFLFMLDELEGLKNVHDLDSQESFHDAFRKLASDENESLGFIVSILTTDEDSIPEFVFRADIINRIGRANIHDLKYLQEDEQVGNFLSGLLNLVVDADKKSKRVADGEIPNDLTHYPFSNEAAEQLIGLAVSAPTASLPRNIIKAVNECAIEAHNQNQFLIDVNELKAAQQIFQEED